MAESRKERNSHLMGQYPTHVLKLFSRASTIAVLMVCAVCVSQAQSGTKRADVIVTHARVYTVNSKQPWAEAIAVREHHIVAVGSAREVERWRGPRTKTIDAQGRLVLPGFFDSHIHFMEGALSLEKVNVDDTK